MTELIMTVVLMGFKFFLNRASNNEKKLKLIEQWNEVLRKDFGASAKGQEEYDKMWKRVKSKPWKETGVES